jgi:putative endonuclease
LSTQPAVYILASRPHGALYVGVTSDIVTRVWQHRNGAFSGFTERYHVHEPVYVEMHTKMVVAIRREKQLEKWNRACKVRLIERSNPRWDDRSPTLTSDDQR